MAIRIITPETITSSLRSIALGQTPELPASSVLLYLCGYEPTPEKIKKHSE